MPNPNDRGTQDIKPYSVEHILNQSFDRGTQTLMFQSLGQDGQYIQRQNAENMSLKVTVSGTATYIAKAAPGTDQASNKWQVKKVDEGTSTVVTWADGDANFDNIATDLTVLTYL